MAHDISQQAFIKAYKYLNSFDASHPGLGKSSANRFRNWLTSIATNCHSDIARSEAKYTGFEEQDTDQVAHTSRTKLSDFEEMIQPLPTRERQLITLRFVYEYSIDEIAGMLAMKSGTVKSQISRTVSKLRLQLVNSQYDTKTESHENR